MNMRQALKSILAFIAAIILIGVLLGYLGSEHFAFDLIAHFRLHLLALAAVILVAALGLRAWRATWRSLVAVIVSLAGLGVLWETPERPGEGIEITVLAANLYNPNDQTDAVADVLLAVDADILITNETTKAYQRGASNLLLRYPYRLALSTTGPILRTVLWSKFPMREGRLMLEDTVEPTGAHAVLEIDPETELSVIGVHLAHTAIGTQARQIEALGAVAEGMPRPMVIAGDFNSTPWSWGMARVANLTGTERIGGYRVTWLGEYPGLEMGSRALLGHPIDHILVSTGIGVKGVGTIELPGSDHRGVWAQLRVPPQTRN